MEALGLGAEGGGGGLVGLIGVVAASVLAAFICLVFRMNPGPNYEQLFREQRRILMVCMKFTR